MNLLKILAEEFFNGGEWNYIFLIIEVGMACAGNHHEELVVLLARGYGKLFIGVAAEIEGVGFLSMKNHNSVLNLTGTAHEREN